MPKDCFCFHIFNLQIANSGVENVSWLKDVLYLLGDQSQSWKMLMLYPKSGIQGDKKYQKALKKQTFVCMWHRWLE